MAYSTFRLNYLCSCGGDMNYGRTLYVFNGSQNESASNDKLHKNGENHKQADEGIPVNKNIGSCLRLLEKGYKVSLHDRDNTITTLRSALAEHERRIRDVGSRKEENDNQMGRTHTSPIQKLLDQVSKLQKEKDMLLQKISDFGITEARIESLKCEVNDDSIDQAELPYQLESCTTDTEKELAKTKQVKHSLSLEVQRLQQENAQLREKLLHLGEDTSDIITTSVKNNSAGDISYDKLGDSGYLDVNLVGDDIRCIKQEGEYKIGNSNKMNLRDVLAAMHKKTSTVHDEFLEVKKAYLLLKREMNAMPYREIILEMQTQVQKTLSDVNTKYKEVVDKYLREMKLRKKYHNELVDLRGNIRVLCRVRPWIKEDGFEENEIVVTLDSDDDSLIKVNNKGRIQLFDVDKVFGIDSTQVQVFDEVSSLVRSVIDGYNVCIFAYGQTGSGKTHTMEGPKTDPGINQRALQLLFEETVDENWQYEITASVMEIYNEVIRDLLNPNQDGKLEVKMKAEGGYHVPGLFAVPVSNLEMVNQVFETGRKNRATASTNMNEHSSRSHCLLCVTVAGYNSTTGSRSLGRLNLVDLAGSERVSKSMADGIHLTEAQNINKSLSCLGDVIHALRNKHNHVPFRNSKLTYLLHDSLGGDSKTLMIVQVAPVQKNVAETVCSLTFGQRVKSVELGAASKNINKSTPAKRPLSVITSSTSLSPQTYSSAPCSPASNQPSPMPNQTSPMPNQLSPTPSTASLTPSESSPSLTGRKQVIFSPKSPSPLDRSTLTPSQSSPSLNGKRATPSAQASWKSPLKSDRLSLTPAQSTPSLNGKKQVTTSSPSRTSLVKSPLSTAASSPSLNREVKSVSPSISTSSFAIRKQYAHSMTPTAGRKLPQTPRIITLKEPMLSKSFTVPANLNENVA